MTTTPHRLRSTDKDLLLAQKVLGGIRRPDLAPAKIDEVVAQSQAEMVMKFVQEKFGTELVTVARKSSGPRNMRKAFNLEATFALKGIKVMGSVLRYTAQVTFKWERVVGVGSTGKACLDDAKEKFRLHIGNNIRDARSELRKQFLKNTMLQVVDHPSDVIPAEIQAAVIETFRLWLGNSIRAAQSTIKKRFYTAVKHEEVRVTEICPACGERKVEFEFWTDKGKQENCAGCRMAQEEALDEDELDEDVELEDDEE